MIKRLVGCIREYKRATILTPLCMVVEVAMEVIIPMLMARLIDDGISKGDMNFIIRMGAVLLGTCAISLLFGALAGHFAAKASTGFARNLRHDMYYKVQDYSFANIDKFSTASIVTRLTTDVANVQQSFQMLTRMAVRSPVMLVFSLLMSFTINARLSLIFLCVIPVLGGGLYLIMSNAHPIFMQVLKLYDKLTRIVQENLRGIRVVKSFVREDFEKQKFNETSQVIFKKFSKVEKLLAFNSPLMQFCMYTCLLLISWFGARMIVASAGAPDGMTTGLLMSLISFSTQILMSLMMLSMVFVMITISRASAVRITEILSEESDIANPENPVYSVPDGSISFTDVGFSYSKDPANLCLSDVNFHIKAGETIGIIGGTGASKTTLTQLIPRLYDATIGTVKVGGVDVRDYDIETLRNAVAIVLQKNELFSGTIAENLRWGNPNATDEQLVKACKLAQADEFISSFPDGYNTHIEQGGTNVSGGQKQRLCIARAILKNPKILILDDSTSAVDTRTDMLIRRAFIEEIPDTTKLIIAQRIASVMDADRIIVMDGGKICAVGTHAELMDSNDIYQEVYTTQMKGGDDDDE